MPLAQLRKFSLVSCWFSGFSKLKRLPGCDKRLVAVRRQVYRLGLRRYLEQVLLDFPDLVVVAGHIGAPPNASASSYQWAEDEQARLVLPFPLLRQVVSRRIPIRQKPRCSMVGRDAFSSWQIPESVYRHVCLSSLAPPSLHRVLQHLNPCHCIQQQQAPAGQRQLRV